ncbi:MAG: flagellar protein FlaG [Fervidobacterium sp.]
MEGVKGINTVPNGNIVFSKTELQTPQSEVVPGKSGGNGNNSQSVPRSQIDGSLNEDVDVLKENLDKLKKIFKGQAEFKIDKDVNKVVIKIKDPDTGEIIRQIPPEMVVKISKNIQELLGVLMDERV